MQLWQPCPKNFIWIPMNFWSKSSSFYRVSFKEQFSRKIFIWTGRIKFWQQHFELSDEFPRKVRQNVNFKYFFKIYICSPSFSGQVECCFANTAKESSQKTWNLLNRTWKILKVIKFFEKKFSINFSCSNVKCNLDKPDERISSKLRKFLDESSFLKNILS